MPVVDEWILFLEENPEFYELSRSGFFISLLESLADRAKSIESIRSDFPFVEMNDLYQIMTTFLKLKVVEEIKIGNKSFYRTAGRGKLLLEKYRKTREFFKV